ncbi:MAG TPA: hypothetical protein VGD99_10980 [Anaerolineae bacterium]
MIHAVYNGLAVPFLVIPEAIPDISDATFMIAGAVAVPLAATSLWLFHRQAPPLQLPAKEPLTTEQRIAIIITLLLMLGVFSVIILLELVVRLNPQLVGS